MRYPCQKAGKYPVTVLPLPLMTFSGDSTLQGLDPAEPIVAAVCTKLKISFFWWHTKRQMQIENIGQIFLSSLIKKINPDLHFVSPMKQESPVFNIILSHCITQYKSRCWKSDCTSLSQHPQDTTSSEDCKDSARQKQKICTMNTRFLALLLLTAVVAATMASVRAGIAPSVREGKKPKKRITWISKITCFFLN